MRLIDADAIGNPYENTSLAFEFMILKKILDDAPTIDAVDKELYEQCKFDKDIAEEQLKNIVRCKDCKFGVYEKGRGIYHTRCEILEFLFQDDDFCSYGERKENVD